MGKGTFVPSQARLKTKGYSNNLDAVSAMLEVRNEISEGSLRTHSPIHDTECGGYR